MSGMRRAEDRLRRLLVMLPWLMEQGEVALADVAERYDMSEAEVTRDLELVAMCGLPPYVDEMVDVFVDDGVVVVGVPRLFTRSLRLTAPEAFSLLASARTAMELPGADSTGPLARGLDKLSRALSDVGLDTGTDTTTGVAVDLDRPVHTDEITEAVADGAELTIGYYTPARDTVADRTVVPRHVFVEAGNWYLRADDERSGASRTFRIDRVESVRRTGVVHAIDESQAAPSPFFADADLPRVTLRIEPRAQWIVDQYPIDDVRRLESGDAEVTLPVASDRWLSRLLVRLGPDVTMVEPAAAAEDAARLAQRMLARYD